MTDGAMRLFVAVRPTLAAATSLGRAAAEVRAAALERGVRARWTAPAGYHVTLAFLGWSRPEVVTALGDALAGVAAAAPSFELATAGLGCFPAVAEARVLFTQVSAGERALAELHGEVVAIADRLGFAPPKRRFHPHLTLARMGAPIDCQSLVQIPSERLRSRSRIDSLVLFDASEINDEYGYRKIASWPLEGDSKAVRRQTNSVERGHHTREIDHGEGSGSGG
jgi:2'-5' RNA ligase